MVDVNADPDIVSHVDGIGAHRWKKGAVKAELESP